MCCVHFRYFRCKGNVGLISKRRWTVRSLLCMHRRRGISCCADTQCTHSGADKPTNGKVSKTRWNRHESTATFACNAGFTFSGTAEVTCSAPFVDQPWPTPASDPTCTGSCTFGFEIVVNCDLSRMHISHAAYMHCPKLNSPLCFNKCLARSFCSKCVPLRQRYSNCL